MSNCRWEKILLIIPLLFATLKLQSPRAIATEVDSIFNSLTVSALENPLTKYLLVAQSPSGCEQVNAKYQQVYSFETQSFYISICQRGDNYFYYRQSKLDPKETLLLSAKIVFGGDVYQAIDGRTIYFVGMDDNGYYSSVMHNNSEIVFEPELKSSSARLAGAENPGATTSSFGLSQSNSNQATSDRLQVSVNDGESSPSAASATFTSKGEIEPEVCTRDRTNVDPNFDGWQEFIGKSPKTVGDYAASKGHYFIYDQNTPKQASIETKDGLIINLDIANVSQTVRRVCVNPIVSNDTQY